MNPSALLSPWAPHARGYCLPGSLLLKLRLGEAPESIPAWNDVNRGRQSVGQAVDGGAIDRIVRRHAGEMRIARLHSAARAQPGQGHRGYDDAEQVFGLARTFRLQLPPGTPVGRLADALSQLATVEAAYPNALCVTPFDALAPAGTETASWDQVNAGAALAYEPGDPTVIVGLVDSGVAFDHPELKDRLRPGLDTVRLGNGDLAQGLELLGDRTQVDNDPSDDYVGHGMGCAGIIGALGLQMAPGLAGLSQILPLRALGAARFPGKPQPVGIGAVSDLDVALKASVDLGAVVINMSFGTDDSTLSPTQPRPHADTVAYALDRGCVLVAASGNTGTEATLWPAAYPGVIAVGAVDGENRPCAFSTRHPNVALCAPGRDVLTLGLKDYQHASGTSFAAPFVAAAAALLVARARRRSFALDSATVRALLVDSCKPFATPAGGCGRGVLDALAALRALDDYIDGTTEPLRVDSG